MTDDFSRFVPISDIKITGRRRWLPVHEGKTIHQFSDHWDTDPRYAVALDDLARKPRSIEAARYFRIACREVARSTDERTVIATILPPGVVCGHTISVERRPADRPNATALSLVALMNSFTFDWLLRQKAAAHVSLYLLSEVPVPELTPEVDRFLAHCCLRLCSNHQGYSQLWAEQLGRIWREPSEPHTWPVLPAPATRWQLRAAIDAATARLYGLSKAQYERVLDSFSHKSSTTAPALCRAAFDEVASAGLAEFCRDHDPYADIPLVTTTARPVIDLRGAGSMRPGLLDGCGQQAGSA